MGGTRYILVVVVLLVFGFYSTKGLDVSTSVGTFSGRTVSVVKLDEEARNVSLFFGIPFAKPPVGDRRFKRPEPADALFSVYDASYHRPQCMQKLYEPMANMTMSEDCLYLNIYTPGSEIPTNKLPVMIWIYGGSFLYGGADTYNAQAITAYNDVIVVTLNYRVDVLGFLSSGEAGSGNYGLWDQNLAIKWVHDNIAAFGGNPEQTTIFGESAGAASVLYQAVYPGNKGLFKRVIAESGSIMGVWAVQPDPESTFKTFARSVGCHGDNSTETMDCLRAKTAEQLINDQSGIELAPNVDGEFVTTNFYTANQMDLLKGLAPLKDIELLSGVNSKDGAAGVDYWKMLLQQYGVDFDAGVSRSAFDEGFIPLFLGQLQFQTEEMVKAAIFAYTDWFDPENQVTIRDKTVDILSDVYFFVPAINLATHFESVSNKSGYFYVFDHFLPLIQKPTWLQGANHAYELDYVFGLPDSMQIWHGINPPSPTTYPAEDRLLSKEIMKMWTNFAKTGDPNSPVNLAPGVVWPKFDSSNASYLHITANMNAESSKVAFAADRIAFWNQLVPAIRQCRKHGNQISSAVNHLGNLLLETVLAAQIILFVCLSN